jgi:hypothetical protein
MILLLMMEITLWKYQDGDSPKSLLSVKDRSVLSTKVDNELVKCGQLR